jgi:hypothetical protein
VCLYVYPLYHYKATARLSVSLRSVLGSGSENVPAAMTARNNRRIVGPVILYAVRVLSKESLWVCMCMCIPLSLLGNNSVKVFSRNEESLVSFSMQSVSYQMKVSD